MTKAVVSILLAVSLGSGGFAAAQDSGERGDRGRDKEAQRAAQQNSHRDEDRRSEQNRGRDEDRQPDGNRSRDAEARNHSDESQGAGPNHAFRTGDRLPAEFHDHRYVVDDWRDRHLSAPPRGYQWVRTGDDYVLVAIPTGVILRLFLVD
jgi:Ni/Co efflux regulator RcnB